MSEVEEDIWSTALFSAIDKGTAATDDGGTSGLSHDPSIGLSALVSDVKLPLQKVSKDIIAILFPF